MWLEMLQTLTKRLEAGIFLPEHILKFQQLDQSSHMSADSQSDLIRK